MTLRIKGLVALVVAGAIASLWLTPHHGGHQWLHFYVYLAAVLLSSGMKVAIPNREGTVSVNLPFILLGILELSPLQAVCLAVCSVIATCRFRVIKGFTIVQIVFNVANVTTATVLAWYTYAAMMRLHPEVAPALALAATVYYVANLAPLAFIFGWQSNISPLKTWTQELPWYLPFYLVAAMLAAFAHFIGVRYGWLTELLLIPMVYTAYRAYRAQIAIIADRERHLEETKALLQRTIESLSMAIEAKDHGTHSHLMRVRVYVSELGRIMKLDPALVQALFTAALLHDIGKLAVPEHIINKPGKLTPEEFQKMKIHTVVGADILARVQFPYPVVPIVRSHHEAWDGSGYPDGLKGEEIPIGARILAVVDCFDALASDRPYRKALSSREAMEVVKSKAGTQFDPMIVQLLEQHYPEMEELARRQYSEMVPLNTDIFVERGASPATGFEGSLQASSGDGAAENASHPERLALLASAIHEAGAVFDTTRPPKASRSARAVSAMIFAALRPLVPFGCLAVYFELDDQLVCVYRDGPLAEAFSDQPIPIGQGVSGWVVQNQRPLMNGNPTVEPCYRSESQALSAQSSALAIPLVAEHGRAFGSVTLYSVGQNAFSEDHLRLLEAMQFRLSLALHNSLQARITEEGSGTGSSPPETSLESFLRRLQAEAAHAQASGMSLAVILCGIDGLSAIGERYGSTAARTLADSIAEVLAGCCGPAAVSARVNESTFALLVNVPDLGSLEHLLTSIAEVLNHALATVPGAALALLTLGASLCPRDGDTAAQLWDAADRDRHRRGSMTFGIRDASMLESALPGVVL
jgi:putative nucleotidyltransferase with HDIG domain